MTRAGIVAPVRQIQGIASEVETDLRAASRMDVGDDTAVIAVAHIWQRAGSAVRRRWRIGRHIASRTVEIPCKAVIARTQYRRQAHIRRRCRRVIYYSRHQRRSQHPHGVCGAAQHGGICAICVGIVCHRHIAETLVMECVADRIARMTSAFYIPVVMGSIGSSVSRECGGCAPTHRVGARNGHRGAQRVGNRQVHPVYVLGGTAVSALKFHIELLGGRQGRVDIQRYGVGLVVAANRCTVLLVGLYGPLVEHALAALVRHLGTAPHNTAAGAHGGGVWNVQYGRRQRLQGVHMVLARPALLRAVVVVYPHVACLNGEV